MQIGHKRIGPTGRRGVGCCYDIHVPIQQLQKSESGHDVASNVSDKTRGTHGQNGKRIGDSIDRGCLYAVSLRCQ